RPPLLSPTASPHPATLPLHDALPIYFLARNVPPGAAASAQSLYAAVSAGLGSGLVMLAAGAIYTAYGGQGYLLMALLSAAGLLGDRKSTRLNSSHQITLYAVFYLRKQ